ncbi:MAG TPA: glycosyltransferase [Polyangiales bacterium]|nr:glycosyltransferase [Polyangiales bacterium]
MDASPAVSVVLPVYNGARYLARSIESVLAQEFRDFELLIRDDGSSDESPSIIASYDDPRIRAYRNPSNLGLFGNLNQLVADSRAPLVRLWAQDDEMRPECLAREVAFHSAHPEIAMGYCAIDYIDEHGAIIAPAPPDGTPAVISPFLASQIMFFHGSISGNIANVMLKRAPLAALGWFREDLKVSGDFELWVRITREHPIGFLREPLVRLRRHSQQFSRRPGVVVTFLRENRAIFAELFARLPAEQRRYASLYRLCHIQRQYAHTMMRSAARGDLSNASACFHELRGDGLTGTLLYWLVSANGRWLRVPPRVMDDPQSAAQTRGLAQT